MPSRIRRSRGLVVVLAVALGIAVAGPPAAVGRNAPPLPDPLGAAPPPVETVGQPYTLDLSQRGDFVAQTNFVQCVGASMQMMLNMIRPVDDRTAATQLQLQDLARSLSGQRPDGVVRKGASVQGWTAGLNALGAGPYRTVGSSDIQAALKLAARAMRETNRPVGLLVWRGRHAWVMAGFTATADPRLTNDFEVTAVTALDPLYPYGSKVWGPSPAPRASLTVATLGRQFVPRGARGALPGGDPLASPAAAPADGPDPLGTWSQGLSGTYVIVMPYTPAWYARGGHRAN